MLLCTFFFWQNKNAKLAIVATENKKRRSSPSPSPTRHTSTSVADARISEQSASLSAASSQFNGVMSPFFMSPIFLPPWGPLFPAAFYPAAVRSIPGFVEAFNIHWRAFLFTQNLKCNNNEIQIYSVRWHHVEKCCAI